MRISLWPVTLKISSFEIIVRREIVDVCSMSEGGGWEWETAGNDSHLLSCSSSLHSSSLPFLPFQSYAPSRSSVPFFSSSSAVIRLSSHLSPGSLFTGCLNVHTHTHTHASVSPLCIRSRLSIRPLRDGSKQKE